MFIKKYGKQNPFKNIVLPIFGIIASAFMIFAAIWAHGITPYQVAKANGTFSCPVLFYLILFAAIMAIGALFYGARDKKKTGKKQ